MNNTRNTRSQKQTAKQVKTALADMRDLCDRMELISETVPRNGRLLYAVKSLNVARNRFRAFVEANQKPVETNGKT